MRILVLVDNVDDLTIFGQPDLIKPLEPPGPRRDLATHLAHLDPAHVQGQFMALRDPHSSPLSPSLEGGSESMTESGNATANYSLNAQGRFDRRALQKLNSVIRQQDIELIHALGPESILYAALAGRMCGIPAIGSMYDVPNFAGFSTFERVGNRFIQLIRRMGINRLIVPSQLLIKQGLFTVHYPPERMEVMYPVIDIRDEAMPPPDRDPLGLPHGPLAVMIAPLEEDQGYYTLIDATQRLLQRVPNAQIAVVGHGSLLLDLTRKSHRLPIRWLGEHVDIREIIAASDVVVVHPKQPGLPIAVLEGAAAGKPVIGTRVAGISEFIDHGVTGLAVTYDDSRDLAIQLGRCLSQEKLDQHLGNNARKRARALLSLEAQRDRITALYETTVYESR